MLIFENQSAETTLPDEKIISGGDFDRVKSVAAGPYLAPFEILGEPIVPGLTQVPLVLQGTFIQITNTAITGTASIGLLYQPTVPFVAAPPGGKIKLAANLIDSDLSIFDITYAFQQNLSAPSFGVNIPANKTLIIGVQYVATGLSLVAQSVAATEAAGNRGILKLTPSTGGQFLATVTVRQFFVSQQGNPLVPIAAAAYSVPIGGGPVITG